MSGLITLRNIAQECQKEAAVGPGRDSY